MDQDAAAIAIAKKAEEARRREARKKRLRDGGKERLNIVTGITPPSPSPSRPSPSPSSPSLSPAPSPSLPSPSLSTSEDSTTTTITPEPQSQSHEHARTISGSQEDPIQSTPDFPPEHYTAPAKSTPSARTLRAQRQQFRQNLSVFLRRAIATLLGAFVGLIVYLYALEDANNTSDDCRFRLTHWFASDAALIDLRGWLLLPPLTLQLAYLIARYLAYYKSSNNKDKKKGVVWLLGELHIMTVWTLVQQLYYEMCFYLLSFVLSYALLSPFLLSFAISPTACPLPVVPLMYS